MAAVSGSMTQSEIGMSFLGPTLEEKFHVDCSSFRILPCLPLVPEVLRDKVHADVSPSVFQDDVKNGYFLVNLSLNQAFGAPEFNEINPEGKYERTSKIYGLSVFLFNSNVFNQRIQNKMTVSPKMVTINYIRMVTRFNLMMMKMMMKMQQKIKIRVMTVSI